MVCHSETPWKRRAVIGCLCLAVVGLFIPATCKRQLTGDEPHYLIMAASLAWDQDLDLKNNYATNRGLPFDPRDAHFVPDPHVVADEAGHWWPQHEPGFPLLLAPWLRLAGFAGVLTFLALVFAAVGVLLGELGVALGFSARTLRTLLALFLTVAPMPYYSLQLFPETTAALLVMVFALSLVKGSVSSLGAFFLGLLVGFLPWLRLRFLPALVAAALAAAVGWRGKPRRVFFFSLGVAGFAELLYFAVLFRQPWPPRTAHHGFGGLGETVAGALGLFLDGHVGLLVLSPIFLLTLAFWQKGFTARPQLGWFLLCCAVGTVLLSGSYRVWTGGWCPQPARHLVYLLPLALIPVAFGLAQLVGKRLLLARCLWASSSLFSLAFIVAPGATYTGMAHRWLEEKTGLPLSRLLPSLAQKELFFGTYPEHLVPLVYFLPLAVAATVFFARGLPVDRAPTR